MIYTSNHNQFNSICKNWSNMRFFWNKKSVWHVQSTGMKKNTGNPKVKSPSLAGRKVPVTEWGNCRFAVPVRLASPAMAAAVQWTPWFGIGQVGPFNIFKVTSGGAGPGQ